MPRRTYNDPPFMVSPGGGGRRQSKLMVLMMLVMLVAVLFVMFKLLPEVSNDRFGGQKGNDLYEQALEAEGQTLYRSAIRNYRELITDPRTEDALRRQAATRLAALYAAQGERLGDREQTEEALERAYRLSTTEGGREAVAEALTDLRGYPVQALDVATTLPRSVSFEIDDMLIPMPDSLTAIANIDGELVTLEELLYAWNQFNGAQIPSGEAFESFVQRYFDMALLASLAQRQDLDQRGAVALDVRLNRLLSLNKAVNDWIASQLTEPTTEDLKRYYEASRETYAGPVQVVAGHIVVEDEETRDEVAEALDEEDESFAEVAREYSLDRDALSDGYLLGEISATDTGIGGVEADPALARRLTQLEEGTTTGPLKLGRGFHWFHIVEKTVPELPEFENVRQQVASDYRAQQFIVTRAQLLDRLREERPIEIQADPMREAFDSAQPMSPEPSTISTKTLDSALNPFNP